MKEKIRVPSWMKLLLKLVVTAGCFWYISRKIDWSESFATILKTDRLWLAIGLLLFTASKLVAAFRLNIYFGNIRLLLTTGNNLRLYWLGMFYNLFLPGGIGGDAYKVILLNRRFPQNVKMLSASVFLDRISGIAGLGVLAAIYVVMVFGLQMVPVLVLISVIPGFLIYRWIVKKYFPTFLPGFYPTFWLGLTVQFLQVICIYCLLEGLQLRHHHNEYILIFLISSIVAVLPFTIGGLGARELVFLWGSTEFMLNKSESIAISLLFYLMNLIISFIGIIWVFNSPLKEKRSQQTEIVY